MTILTRCISLVCVVMLCAVVVAPSFADDRSPSAATTDNVASARGEAVVFDRTPYVGHQTDNPAAILFDNGPLSTGATSKSGVAAPAGSTWSEAQNPLNDTTQSNTNAGYSGGITTTRFRLADNFTVPAGTTWTIDSLATFAYQTGSTPITSPFIAMNAQIWSGGRPGDPGAVVAGGDTTTNRLGRSAFSTYYRIFNSKYPTPGTAPGTTRPVYRNVANMGGIVLGPGTYWLDWQTQVTASAAHFAPAVTVVGRRGDAAWNGRQWIGTLWQDAIDAGNPAAAPDSLQDFPFVIYGRTTSLGTTYNVPEILYLKFNAGTTTTPNYAVPGRGNATATVTGHTIAPGGQFDSTLLGGEGTGSTHWVDNVWAPNFGNGSWTIGLWLSGLHLPTLPGNPCYLFGDVNTTAFRCFWAGAGISAVDTAILLRKTGQPDMRLVLPNPSLGQASYVHFVYDSVTSTLKGYRNGVLGNTVTWTAPAITGPGPFKIAGYSTSANSLVSGAKMDEFRVYSRALDTTEIRNTWNRTLPATVTDVREVANEIPTGFELAQNYPNPFNPSTTIQFGLPVAADVTLKIYNVLGQEVITLYSGQRGAGTFHAVWNGRNSAGNQVASGMYFYSLVAKSADNASTFTNIKKMLFLK